MGRAFRFYGDWLGACLALLFMCVAPVHGQTPPPKGQFPGVNVDPAAGVITDPLPFDEPFLLKGPALGYGRVAASWCDTGKVGSSMPTPYDPNGDWALCAQDKRVNETGVWRRSLSPDPNAASFSLLVGPVPPNRRLLFKLDLSRNLDATQLQALRSLAEKALDKKFRELHQEQDATLSNTKYSELQNRIWGALKGIPKDPSLTLDPNSSTAFDPNKSPDARWTGAFDDVWSLHRSLKGLQDDFDKVSARATDTLNELSRAPESKSLHDGLLALTAKSDLGTGKDLPLADLILLGDVLLSSRAADINARLGGGKMSLTLNAIKPLDLASVPDVREAWAPEELDLRISNLKASEETLANLLRVVDRAARDKTLASALSLDPTSILSLQSKLKADVDAMEAVRLKAQAIRSTLAERVALLKQLSEGLAAEARENVFLTASPRDTYVARAMWYISVDLGLAYAWDVEGVFPYVGTSFAIRPVNKSRRLQGWDLSRRCALLIGLTASSVQRKAGERVLRDDLFATSAGLLGAGIRLTDYIRVSAGALLYRKNDPNPLINDMRITADPFVSLSFDWDIKGSLGKLGNIGG
jgi:hypothetical protein